MHKAAAAAITAATFAISACGQARSEDGGPTISRNYPVGNFTELELAGAYDVQVRTGAKPSVSASGPEKMIERLEVEVRGSKLLIHPRKEKGWFHIGWNKGEKVQVTVTVPALQAATLAGSGLIAVDKVQGERFEGQIAGSGDLRLGSVDVGALKIGIAGSGDANAGSGKAKSADYEIAGSGGVDGSAVVAEDLSVSIAGSGDVKAHATRAAKVDIMGSGDVEVAGGAKCSVHKAGSGDVRCP